MENTMDARTAMATLGVDIIPGTEIMRDVGETHFAHAHGSETGSVLVPQPSLQSVDPLNWSRTWKVLTISCQAAYTFVTVMAALSIAPMFPLLAEEFSLNQQQLGMLTGVAVITLGYANFLVVPFSNIFGRRPTSILFAIFTLATSIWVALAKSHSSLLAARACNGLATATNESLMMQVVADVFFLHERGFWTGIYFTAYFMGLFFGPVISGPLSNRYGWRSFFWLATGLAALNVALLLVAFPETKFHRDSRGQDQDHEDKAENLTSEKCDAHHTVVTDPSTTETANSALIPPVGKGSPTRHSFALFRKPDPRWKQFLVRDINTPIRAFLYPIIFWAGLLVASSANTLLLWNMTESAVLSNAPYNWTPTQVGFANFAFAIGGFVGLATAGPFSDWVAKRATKGNKGIREAEMRLPALIPFAILSSIGIVIGGLGYERLWPWESILVVGFGLTGLSVTSVPTIAAAYAIDCYKPISGEIMVVATVLKNTQGFGMSYWVPPLAEQHGLLTVCMVQFALHAGGCLIGIAFYIWGKQLRRLTKDSKMHQMEDIIHFEEAS